MFFIFKIITKFRIFYSRFKLNVRFAFFIIFKTPSGYVQQVPQVSIAQQNMKLMQSFATEFGLTPACRARIVAANGKAGELADDPMERLLKGGWKDDV